MVQASSIVPFLIAVGAVGFSLGSFVTRWIVLFEIRRLIEKGALLSKHPIGILWQLYQEAGGSPGQIRTSWWETEEKSLL